MTSLTLIGVDPGIRDTAATVLRLNTSTKELEVDAHVWHDITTRDGWKIVVDREFLDRIATLYQDETDLNGATFAFIEGYRARGKDLKLDQNMNDLVQTINRTLPGSVIVDNTGVRKLVTEPLLKLFHCARFKGTNHADSKSAARIALAGAVKSTSLNEILYQFVEENLPEEMWSFASM